MADNLDKIEKRLEAIESRLSHLEGSRNIDKIVEEAHSRQEEKKDAPGPTFPIGSLIILALGALILWNSVPSLLSRMFFGSYGYYGRSYFDFGSLIFAVFGVSLFLLGLKGFINYRNSKQTSISGKTQAGVLETAKPLQMSGVSVSEKKSEDRSESIEYRIASHWFSIVGVVAILLGSALFLKYAFDNNWIGPAGQVSIGVIFGLFLLGLGDYFRSKYAQYSQILSGCGLGVLYLSLWGAYAIFKLIDVYTVLGAMTLVTAAAALLAIRYNSVYIAALGILGGFATPLLLGEGVDQVMLLTYVLVLNLGVLTIAFFKNWRKLNLLTFAATYIDFSIWYSNLASRSENTLEAFIFLTIFFVIFSLVWVVYNLVNERNVEDTDILLSLLNAFVYFGFSFMILNSQYKIYMGFFAFAIAFYYAIFGFIAYAKFKADSVLTLGFLGTAILFLTMAVPLQVQKNLITIVWAIEGAVLVWLSFWIKSYKLRVAALVIYVLVAIRLVAFDANLPLDQFILIFNKRFLTYVIAAVSAGITGYLYFVYRQNVQEDEKPVLPALLIGLNVVLVAALTLESVNYFEKKINEVENPHKTTSVFDNRLSLVGDVHAQSTTYVYWVHEKGQLESGCCIEVNPSTPTSAGSYTFTLSSNAITKNYEGVVCSPDCDSNVIWTGPVFFTLNQARAYSVTLGPNGPIGRVEPNLQPSSPYSSNQYRPPANINNYPNKTYKPPDPKMLEEIRNLENRRNISISIIWLVYSLILLIVGVGMKYKPVRLSALAFFAVTILKVFLYDSSSLQQLYRIIAFIVLGTILLIVAYIYQRYKQQINAFLLND